MVFAVTVGTAGLATAIGGAAIAGAAALGLAGLVGLAAHKRGRGRGRGGRRRFGGRRHGREVPDDHYTASANNLLAMARHEDVTTCALRMVCEFSKMPAGYLQPEEQEILDMIGPVARPGEGFHLPGGAEDFKQAKKMGIDGGDCAAVFALCPFNGHQVMEGVRAILPDF